MVTAPPPLQHVDRYGDDDDDDGGGHGDDERQGRSLGARRRFLRHWHRSRRVYNGEVFSRCHE